MPPRVSISRGWHWTWSQDSNPGPLLQAVHVPAAVPKSAPVECLSSRNSNRVQQLVCRLSPCGLALLAFVLFMTKSAPHLPIMESDL